jgi:hypothetical protein
MACNPFGGSDAEEKVTNAPEVAEVSFERSTPNNVLNDQAILVDQPAEQPVEEADNRTEEVTPEPTLEEPTPTSNPEEGESLAESPALETFMVEATEDPLITGPAAEARDLVWAFLSQCVSFRADELEAHEIKGEWFVQAAGENPNKFGVWKVDLVTGGVHPHNIRAREWSPLVNSECSEEVFSELTAPAPATMLDSGITEEGQAVTAVWARLVRCYPALDTNNLQATLNPVKAEWIVTARPEIPTNYGVWAVKVNGIVSPHNRQAQGVDYQLDNGVC